MILGRDTTRATHDNHQRGYDIALVITDLTSSAEEIIARYAARWSIEVASSNIAASPGPNGLALG